jgi:hypothetical protein
VGAVSGTFKGYNEAPLNTGMVYVPTVGNATVDLSEIKFTPDWRAFFADCDMDEPNRAVLDTLWQLHRSGADIWIWSGRSDEVRDKTEQWLEKHLGLECWYFIKKSLRMRHQGDYTPDEKLKKSWYDSLSSEDKARLVAIFDDRAKVVRMWRELGVACFQVAEGDF